MPRSVRVGFYGALHCTRASRRWSLDGLSFVGDGLERRQVVSASARTMESTAAATYAPMVLPARSASYSSLTTTWENFFSQDTRENKIPHLSWGSCRGRFRGVG
jgi:hypothetical protein